MTESPGINAARDIRSWLSAGATSTSVWGEYQGSGSTPYRTAIDLTGPVFRCSCPSRKVPCKHALSLLLLHADGAVPGSDEPPQWAQPKERASKTPADPEAARRRADQRAERVASGLRELDQWLRDQVSQGLATVSTAGYQHWDAIAARMVDAQCPAVAERLRALASAPHSGAGWEGRLLEELALLRLLGTAYQRRDELPEGLMDTVRSRIGFTVRQADVIATAEPVRDIWDVLGWRDIRQERITTRRVWLRGQQTGRPALVLSFAAAGESLDTPFTPGTSVHAGLAFYPAATPLRAVVADRAGTSLLLGERPEGSSIASLLDEIAGTIGEDPWLEAWPAVLADVTPARSPEPCVIGQDGQALPLHPSADSWQLLAVSGGRPVTLAAEWTPRGLWPLTAWPADGPPVPF